MPSLSFDDFVRTQIYPQLIQDAFFTASPLMDYLRDRAVSPFGAADFAELEEHIDGELCEYNIHCEECYA